MYSKSIEHLIQAFGSLPSVGPRTAERFVFYLLKSGKKDVAELTLALKELIESVKSCEICWTFSDTNPCAICASTQRDPKTVCVVAEPQDREVIEKTGTYRGGYHILRGVIKGHDENSFRGLKIPELLARIRKSQIEEIILALNPDLHGETTMMYLEKKIKEIAPQIKVSRLARGLPMGSDLQYADDITLSSALKNRTSN
ncbi:MAG TPA: recombination mediator RecR [Candidatus Magasanikbacteria bacterium]|nr:recombination mediator RecR [Candidatus Magasanikbacteria bacterium]